MPASEAHKRANAKWNKENMTTLGVFLKKTDANAFKEYAARHGKTVGTMLREYIFQCLEAESGSQETPEDSPD